VLGRTLTLRGSAWRIRCSTSPATENPGRPSFRNAYRRNIRRDHPPLTSRLQAHRARGTARCQNATWHTTRGLAARVRALIASESGLVEKGMSGGLAFLLDGNMAVGVRGDDLIVRTDPAT
jgi:hypothetical protein